MTRSEVADLIAGLFGDGGATVLNEADMGATWNEVVAGIPPQVLAQPVAGPHPPGELWLARLRDHWARTGQLRPAIAATRGLIRRRVARLGRQHPDTLFEVGAMGALADRAGRHDDARKLLEEAWQGLRSVAGGRDLRVAIVAEHAGFYYLRAGKLHEAELAFEQAYRIRKEQMPGSQSSAAAQLADLWVHKGRPEDAVPLLREAHALNRDRFGPLHARTLASAQALADTLTSLDRHGEAEPVLRDLHEVALKSGDRERIAATAFQLGVGLYRLKQGEEGYRTIESSIRMTRDLGDPHPALSSRLVTWSKLLRSRRHLDEAEGVLKEAIEAEERLYGADSPQVAARYLDLVEYLVGMGRNHEAMGWVDPAYNLLRGELGVAHPLTHRAAHALSLLLLDHAVDLLDRDDRRTAREIQAQGADLAAVLGDDDPALTQLRQLRI